MFSSTEQAFVFAAEMELEFRKLKQGVPAKGVPRDADEIMRSFARYSKTKFHIFSLDFISTIGASEAFEAQRPNEIPLQSLLLNHIDNGYCDILIYSALNNCWDRFCRAKEAAHVPIRTKANRMAEAAKQVIQEFDKIKDELEAYKEYMCDDTVVHYPDTASERQIISLFHDTVTKKFSINDFDKKDYPIELRAENSAEIIAILLLFPPHEMINERNSLLLEIGSIAGDLCELEGADFMPIAKRWKVPLHYVELFLTWDGLEHRCGIYEQRLNRFGTS